jgi:predicted RNase H-like HicB family nuclease
MQAMLCTAVYNEGKYTTPTIIKLRRTFHVSYLVVILNYYGTYNAFIPDVPGCIATSTDFKKVKQLIAEGLEIHIPAILEAGLPLPEPKTVDFDDQLEADDELVECGLVRIEGEIHL